MLRGPQFYSNTCRNVSYLMCFFKYSALSFHTFLFLTRFTETETYMEVFSLHVGIIEPECNIIKMGPKPLQVFEFYGLSDAIDGNVLSFHYERKPGMECSIQLNPHLPVHGQLVTGNPETAAKRGDEPESFIFLRQQLGEL